MAKLYSTRLTKLPLCQKKELTTVTNYTQTRKMMLMSETDPSITIPLVMGSANTLPPSAADTIEQRNIEMPFPVVTSSSSSSSSCGASNNNSMTYQPGPFDVICGRGRAAFTHSGNKFFRKLITEYVEQYENTTSKAERSSVVSNVVDIVRLKGNGFVKQEADGTWVEVGDTLAREKVCVIG